MKRSSSTNQSTKGVNTLLHNLRGEQYRHAQNIERSRSRFPNLKPRLSYASRNNPTLPISEIFGERAYEDEALAPTREDPFLGIPRSRPTPQVEREQIDKEKDGEKPLFWMENNIEWREEALSLILQDESESGEDSYAMDTSIIPPLTQLCLQALLLMCSARQFTEDVIPWIAPHLRGVLLRWASIHAPLSSAKLYALCEPDGSIDGQLIVVGPQASLRSDFFQPEVDNERQFDLACVSSPPGQAMNPRVRELETEDDEDYWDSPSSSSDSSPPLTSLSLLYTSVPTSTILTLPPTLTHLALLALLAPISIYHLTRICPLLEFLDISYNPWLRYVYLPQSGSQGLSTLERVQWKRWSRLRVLGVRKCGIDWDLGKEVNKGRWVDVKIIGVNAEGKDGS